MSVPKEVADNPLLSLEVQPINNWFEWLALWQESKTFEEKMGLLHCGFNVRMDGSGYLETKYDHTDRIIFYLSVANGWTDNSVLRLPDENSFSWENGYYFGTDHNGNIIRKTPSEMRQMLARKAFDMLCQNFFKKHNSKWNKRENIHLERVVMTPKLFPFIQNFFWLEENFQHRLAVKNLRTHDELSPLFDQAKNFLLYTCIFVWEWRESPIESYFSEDRKKEAREYNSVRKAMFEAAKPWTVEVLVFLNQLDILSGYELPKKVLAQLLKIALKQEVSEYHFPVKKSRPAKSLTEACLAGSRAGRFLRDYELNRDERARLQLILDAESQRDIAVKKVEELTKSVE